jgi:hypothetical protein
MISGGIEVHRLATASNDQPEHIAAHRKNRAAGLAEWRELAA